LNAEATIVKTLETLAAQERKPDAVVLVDDGSSDETVAAAERFSGALPPLRILRHSRTGGAAAARNSGAKELQTEYLFFCDADVRLHPRALAVLEHALEEHPKAAFSYGPFRYNTKLFRVPPFSLWLLERYNYIVTMSALVRRKDFPGFDERLKRFQDWDLWLRMARAGKRGVPVSLVLLSTESRPGSISHERSRHGEEEFRRTHGLPSQNRIQTFFFKLLLRVLSWK
jgi:glycosyltransferase involved in cell wall biosynthesis